MPLTVEQGRTLLAHLETRLSPATQARLADSFADARLCIDRLSRAGGVTGFYIRSFPARDDARNRRVDLEVRAGEAFIP